MDIREVKANLLAKLKGAIPAGPAAIEAVFNDPTIPKPEEMEGPVGEAMEQAIHLENLQALQFFGERFRICEDPWVSVLFKRRFMEEFLIRVRENMWTGTAKARNEMFEYITTLPNQVNAGSIGQAQMMHNGKTYLARLKSLAKRNEHDATAAAAADGSQKKSKTEESDEENSSVLQSSEPFPLDSIQFIKEDFVGLLGCKKDLRLWSDGEVSATEKTASGGIPALKIACDKIDKEFAKDEWDVITCNEHWRGFYVKCPLDAAQMNPGEAMARTVLGVDDRGRDLEVRIKQIADTRATLFPQRHYFLGTHVSKSKLAMVKRATNLIRAPLIKNSLFEVKFYTEERAWWWPPIIFVGRSKADPNYLAGVLCYSHDQEHLHHGN